MQLIYISFLSVLLILEYDSAVSQQVNSLGQTTGYIPTAVPFLLIAPDARSNGMGDVGAATSADVNSLHWNASKLAFINSDFGISVSYLPWLRQLLNDVNYSNISAFIKIDSNQKIGCSLKYFSFGSIDYTFNGNSLGSANPVEYSIDLNYSRKLSLKTSGAISARHIYSEALNSNVLYHPAPITVKTFAFDLSLFHFNPVTLFAKKSHITYGISLTNIGPMIENESDSVRFLPANLRIGTSLKIPFNEKNSVEISFDANKLLTPTNPIGEPNDPKSWSEGFFGSFSDAPGGFKEELHEINLSAGIEYWFKQFIALRTGYFYEHPEKGNRQFLTLGSGIKYNNFQLDASYLVSQHSRNPLENTICFSLSWYFSKSIQERLKNLHFNG